jgi:LysW-gamma-L-lysine carboxypeptidase
MASGQDGFVQWAKLNLMARLPVELSPTAWYRQLASLLPDTRITPLGEALGAYQSEKNSPLVRAFLRAIRGQGGTPAFVNKTGTSDLNILAPIWGCPALVYGPGDSTLDHTPDEHLSITEYRASVRVLVDGLRELMGRGDASPESLYR